MPEVSVVIPTFNRREFAASAVSSVLAQTFADLELIVVDDGSEDGTAHALRERFTDPRMKVVERENGGVSAARNLGAALATGRYLAFLDSDDSWEPQKLSRQLEALAGNPGHRVCYTDETWYRRGKWANQCGHHAKHSGDIFANCLPLCIISPSSVLMEWSLFVELGGFDQSMPACEDYDLWLRLAARHPVLFLPERLIVKVNGHEGQLSATVVAQDRYRVRALWKVALDGEVSKDKRRLALSMIRDKSLIVAQGAAKRGAAERALSFEFSAAKAAEMLGEFER